MLTLSSSLKTLFNEVDQFFFGCLFPAGSRVVGVVISEKLDSVLQGNSMLLHIVSDQWIGPNFPSGFHQPPPGGAFSLGRGSSSMSSTLSGISSVFRRVTSFLVADETLAVLHMFSPLAGGEIDLIDIHGIWIGACSLLCQGNVAVAFSSEFPESYHISVELSCLVKPLLSFPA